MTLYLYILGKSVRRLWSDILKIIQDVYFSVEEDFKKQVMTLGNLRQGFKA